MQRKSSILGPNIVNFGTHFDISSFPDPNMQHTLILRPANARLSTQKWSPKCTQNLVKWVSIFSTLFDAVMEHCFQGFCLPNGPKMVPKNVSFLKPPTLLKCKINNGKISLFLILERVHFWGLFLRPLQNTLLSILVNFWGPVGHPLEALFRYFFRPHFQTPIKHSPQTCLGNGTGSAWI